MNVLIEKNTEPVTAHSMRVFYPEDANNRCFHLEQKSVWYRHRNSCIVAAMLRYPSVGIILDVGGGNGCVAKAIRDAGFRVRLLEPDPSGILNAIESRHITDVMCARFEDADIPERSIDAVGLFDVLEHIDNEKPFLDHIADVLKPKGLLYITVPAHRFLWSWSDVQAEHFRRYSRQALVNTISASFDVIYSTYFFGALVMPIFLFRTIPYRAGIRTKNILKAETEHGTDGSILPRMLLRVLSREVRFIRYGRQSLFGASCLLVARTPG